MSKTKNEIMTYALIGFLLLAILFGMQIMTFIFGNIGKANSDTIADVSQSVINETAAFANLTGYTLVQSTQSNFSGGATITAVWNSSNLGGGDGGYNISVPLTNVSVTSGGVLTNGTNAEYSNLSVSYTTNHKTSLKVDIENINNNSLNAIENYSTGAGTQFNVLQIVITLILLVGVFVFFWKTFMGSKKQGGAMGGSFG